MQTYGSCKKCGCAMAVLDMMLEGMDLACMRCGIREVINHSVTQAIPCSQ